jgi:hypothetical protein
MNKSNARSDSKYKEKRIKTRLTRNMTLRNGKEVNKHEESWCYNRNDKK